MALVSTAYLSTRQSYIADFVTPQFTLAVPVFLVEQNFVGISAVMFVVFYRHLKIQMMCHRAVK